MPAQQRDARRNYIGIVDDRAEEQRAAESPAKSDRVIRSFFIAVTTAVRKLASPRLA